MNSDSGISYPQPPVVMTPNGPMVVVQLPTGQVGYFPVQPPMPQHSAVNYADALQHQPPIPHQQPMAPPSQPTMTVEELEEAFMDDDEAGPAEPELEQSESGVTAVASSSAPTEEQTTDDNGFKSVTVLKKTNANSNANNKGKNKKQSSSKNANRQRQERKELSQYEKERRQQAYDLWRQDQDLYNKVRAGDKELHELEEEFNTLRQSDSRNIAEILRGKKDKLETRRSQLSTQADSRKKKNKADIKKLESEIERLEAELKNSDFQKKLDECKNALYETRDNVRELKRELNELRAAHPVSVLDFAFYKKNPAPWGWFREVEKQKYFALQNTPNDNVSRVQLIEEYTHICTQQNKEASVPNYKPNKGKANKH